MKLTEFNIDFIKFKNETDTFALKLDDSFFTLKENSLYHACALDVNIECTKRDNTIKLNYSISGQVSTSCERCLETIAIPLQAEGLDALRLTGDEELLNNENYLSIHHQVFSTYDSIYEIICLNMPTRKVCETSLKNKACTIDYASNEIEQTTDPRWDELKKLIK